MAEADDIFDENDIADWRQEFLTAIYPVYWTFPAPDRDDLPLDQWAAFEASHTVARQRVEAKRIAAAIQTEIGDELAIQFDYNLDLSNETRASLIAFVERANLNESGAVAMVYFPILDGWRRNKVFEQMLGRANRLLRLNPPSELTQHFLINRHWDRQAKARAAARRAREPYQARFTVTQISNYYDYMTNRIAEFKVWSDMTLEQKAKLLVSYNLKTISGLKFNVERMRDFEEGLAQTIKRSKSV